MPQLPQPGYCLSQRIQLYLTTFTSIPSATTKIHPQRHHEQVQNQIWLTPLPAQRTATHHAIANQIISAEPSVAYKVKRDFILAVSSQGTRMRQSLSIRSYWLCRDSDNNTTVNWWSTLVIIPISTNSHPTHPEAGRTLLPSHSATGRSTPSTTDNHSKKS